MAGSSESGSPPRIFSGLRRYVRLLVVVVVSICGAMPAYSGWGSYLTPFAASSPWNIRPLFPVFGSFVIPTSIWAPGFEETRYSTGVFLAQPGDPAVTVTGTGSRALFDQDSEAYRDVTIPRWPASVAPAPGSDGHAEIVDPVTGIVHSFSQLAFVNGRWTASLYAWSRIDGRGWGDPAHYYQGVRATGVPPTGGLIRKDELANGEAFIRHALAVSLTNNGLASSPAYVFPATSADQGAAGANSGQIPEGALLMLPGSFDVSRIADPKLRKVAQTLKLWGAYVVDRNYGVPFLIYAEPGTGLAALNTSIAADMETIRLALRQVTSSRKWADGYNRVMAPPEQDLNLLSMRGAWTVRSGPSSGYFDTYQQAVVIPAAAARTTLVNWSTRGLTSVVWSTPRAGDSYRLTADTTGMAALRIQLYDAVSKRILYDSGDLYDGEFVDFVWPVDGAKINVYATSGVGETSTVRGDLRLVP